MTLEMAVNNSGIPRAVPPNIPWISLSASTIHIQGFLSRSTNSSITNAISVSECP